jgi:hypothetical protein
MPDASSIYGHNHQFVVVESPSPSVSPKCHPACADDRCTSFGGPPSTCLGHCSDGFVPSSLGGGCQVAHVVSFVVVLQNQPGIDGNCTSLNLTALTVPELFALRQHIAAPLQTDWKKLFLQGISCTEIQDAVTLKVVKTSIVASFSLNDQSGLAALQVLRSVADLSNRLSSVLVAGRVLAVTTSEFSKVSSPCFASCETCLDLSRESCLTCQPGFSLSVRSESSALMEYGQCFAGSVAAPNMTAASAMTSQHRSISFPFTAQLIAGVLGGCALLAAVLMVVIYVRKPRNVATSVHGVVCDARNGLATETCTVEENVNLSLARGQCALDSHGPSMQGLRGSACKAPTSSCRTSSKAQRKPERERIRWLTSSSRSKRRAVRKKPVEAGYSNGSQESVHSAEMVAPSSRSRPSTPQQRSIVEHGGEVLQTASVPKQLPVHIHAKPDDQESAAGVSKPSRTIRDAVTTHTSAVLSSRCPSVAFAGAENYEPEPEWQDYATWPPRSFRLDDDQGSVPPGCLDNKSMLGMGSLSRSTWKVGSRRKA